MIRARRVDRAELAQERQVQVVRVLVRAEHERDVGEIRRRGGRRVAPVGAIGQERVDQHPAVPRHEAKARLAVPGDGDVRPGLVRSK